ncbi:unnamed protein product [Durusdinium trenchii]|uniref:Uncharacterized protein n=1 Tax=Durusdinium trenchii TaxID=1381693 RepID=A0ABP0M9F6_9DINO
MAEQVKKLQACQALAQGKKLKSLHHIQQALELAHEAGLSHMEMKAAMDAQKEIKKMDEAAEKLEDAVEKREYEKLKWAIKWAKDAKVDEDDAADAEEVLQEVEKHMKLMSKLQKAEASGDLELLVEALKEAEGFLEEEELEPFEEALVEGRQGRAREALKEAMQSRSVPALKEALRLAEAAELEGTEEVLASHRALAEMSLMQALKGQVASHTLRSAIEEADAWAADFEELEGARRKLQVEEHKDAARARLQGALRSREPNDLALAIRAGREAALEDWEMRGAEKALDAIRQQAIDDLCAAP